MSAIALFKYRWYFRTLEYIATSGYLASLIHTLNNLGNLPKVATYLITNNYKSDLCIYAIPCSECNLHYIGVSDIFDRSIGQHKNNLRRCEERNSIFKHVSTKNHNVSISNCNIILRINNVHTIKLVESFLIKNTENMNSYEASVKIDNVTSELLKKNVYSSHWIHY